MLEILLRTAQINLGYAKALLRDVPDEDLCIVPSPGMNHPAWIVGHIAMACDTITGLLEKPTLTDDAWRGLFGSGSEAVAERERYPSKEVLLGTFAATMQAASDALRVAPAELLDRELPKPEFRKIMPTIGIAAANILSNHAALHLGQLSAWRRLRGYPGVMKI